MWKSVANKLREVFWSLCCAAVRPQLEYWVRFWASQFKRDRELLEIVRWSAMKKKKGLEHVCEELRLRDQDYSSWKTTA